MDNKIENGGKYVNRFKCNSIWVICILGVLLIISIAFNIIGLVSNDGCADFVSGGLSSYIVSYISFASTLLSVVLAIVAIIYSFMSTTKGDRQWSQIDSAVTEIRATNQSIQNSEQQMVNAVIDIARKLGAIDARTQNSAGHAESTQESAFDNTDKIPSNERKN